MLHLINSVRERSETCRFLHAIIQADIAQIVPVLAEKFGPIEWKPSDDGKTPASSPSPTFITTDISAFTGCHFLKVEKDPSGDETLVTVEEDATGVQHTFSYPDDSVFDDDECLLDFVLSSLSAEQIKSLGDMTPPCLWARRP